MTHDRTSAGPRDRRHGARYILSGGNAAGASACGIRSIRSRRGGWALRVVGMSLRKLWLVVGLVAVLSAVAAPAQAERIKVKDPEGDTYDGRRLDITGVEVRNRDHAVVTKVSFVQAGRGDLVLLFQARGDSRRDFARVISHHRPKRGDINVLDTADGVQTCDGLRVRWDHGADSARVRLPSRCFRGGDYGAVHVRVLTEIVVDQDYYAPSADAENWRWTPWVARG